MRYLLLVSIIFLSGCLGTVWTGAQLAYDRHSVYHRIDDFHLGAEVNRALYRDRVLKQPGCYLDVAVFNGDILLAGHLPTRALWDEARRRVKALSNYRRFFMQVSVAPLVDNPLLDSWITMETRTQIFANADIDPHQFKVITSDQVVYLMGDVLPEQAENVVLIARQLAEVKRVVKLFKYYHLSNSPGLQSPVSRKAKPFASESNNGALQ